MAAIRTPDVTQAESEQIAQAAQGTSIEDINAAKNLRFWIIELTDPITVVSLSPKATQALDEKPMEFIRAVHQAFYEQNGVDPLGVARMNPEVLRYVADNEKIGSEALSMRQAASSVEQIQSPLDRLVQQVGRRVLVAAGREDVQIIFDPGAGLNAFVPTEFGADEIYVGPELVLTAMTDDQLACVIGHELAHIEAGHATSDSWLNLGKDLLATTASVAAAAAIAYSYQGQRQLSQSDIDASNNMGKLTTFVLADAPLRIGGWDRGQEEEADALGLYFATQAGYAPAACAQFMMSMLQTEAASGEAEGAWWWRTHPVTSERVVALQKLAVEAEAGTLKPR